MSSDQDTTDLFICSCGTPSHQFIVSYFADADDDLLFTVHLGNDGFWKRLRIGIGYIFGQKSVYGHFEEVFLDDSDALRLYELLARHLHRHDSTADTEWVTVYE